MRFFKYIFLGILLAVSSVLVSAQGQNDIPSGLITSLKKGDSSALSGYFGDRIQLQIQNKEAIHSKSQAKQIMAKFFKEFPPTAFKKKHIGGKPGARYMLGFLTTSKGMFRVNLLLKEQGGKQVVHQLKIEKE